MSAIDTGIDFSRFERLNALDYHLPIEERWRQIVGLVGIAVDLENASPNPEGIRRVREKHEAAWQRAVERLIANANRG